MADDIKRQTESFFNLSLSKGQEMMRGFRSTAGQLGRGSLTRGVRIGYEMGFKGGSLFVIGGAAYGVATAPRGHALSEGIGQGLSFGVTSLIGGAAGELLGGPIGAYIGSFAGQIIGESTMAKAIAGTIQPMVDFGSNMRRARFGGDYRDTQTAYTMRSTAAREMSRSLMNARQWLGVEASFLHQ